MGWRDIAKQVQGGGANRDFRANSPPNSPNDPIVPNGSPPLDPIRALKLCDRGLATLSPAKPLHGLSLERWARLLEDAQWVRDAFAPGALRNGWSVPELLGLWHYDGGLVHCAGGVADRLDGARSLVMTEDRATWRTFLTGEPASFFRGVYPNLKVLWES